MVCWLCRGWLVIFINIRIGIIVRLGIASGKRIEELCSPDTTMLSYFYRRQFELGTIWQQYRDTARCKPLQPAVAGPADRLAVQSTAPC